MSRYFLQIEQYEHEAVVVEATLAYGFDYIVGYFYQVFLPHQDAPVEDRDSWRGLSRSQFIERIDALAVALPESHRRAIALDLPF